jgi:hypothetical protein
MPVMYILDFADGTVEAYERVVERMQLGGRLPDRALFHGAGTYDGGLRGVDVWESADAFQSFAQEQIAPHSAAEGLAPPAMQRREVTQLRRGPDEDVTFLQVIYLPGIDREAFEAMDARVLADGGFPPEGCVFHVNGPYEGGHYVMDAWTSKELRDRFIETRVRPTVIAAGMDRRPDYEDLVLHNSLRHGAATERATA